MAAKAHVADLASRAADKDDDADKELSKLMKEHASTHMDAKYLEAPIVCLGTEALIVDPMHGLELNSAKTAWKHSVGNRMSPHHCERVADYLNQIGCPLDIREKGKRDSKQKWFTASTFDEFVNGVSCKVKSASPGLAENMWAICERVFDGQSLLSACPLSGGPILGYCHATKTNRTVCRFASRDASEGPTDKQHADNATVELDLT
eukprot:3819785-Pleurochrysis_carterae.AAC.1